MHVHALVETPQTTALLFTFLQKEFGQYQLYSHRISFCKFLIRNVGKTLSCQKSHFA